MHVGLFKEQLDCYLSDYDKTITVSVICCGNTICFHKVCLQNKTRDFIGFVRICFLFWIGE